MLAKLKALCLNSSTIAWSYVMGAGGFVIEAISDIPDIMTTVGLQQYVPPQWLGRYTLLIAALTWLARIRGIIAARKGA